MERHFVHHGSPQDLVTEGTETRRIALVQQVPHPALAAARDAARAALLALGRAPRRAETQELALLRDVATATPQRFAGRPAEQQALVDATRRLLDRLFPPPAATPGRGGDDRPGAGRPAGTGGWSWQ